VQVYSCFMATHKSKLANDKGYNVHRVRDWLRKHRIEPVIPHKDNEKARHDPNVVFDKETYRVRAVVEQCVGWLKGYCRIGTRFEKLAVNDHGMLQLAMIRCYLRLLSEPEPCSRDVKHLDMIIGPNSAADAIRPTAYCLAGAQASDQTRTPVPSFAYILRIWLARSVPRWWFCM
jgi:transposase